MQSSGMLRCVPSRSLTLIRMWYWFVTLLKQTSRHGVKRDGCLLTSSFTLANLGRKQNLSVISTMATKVAVAFVAEGPFSRSLKVYASETTSPLSSHNVQGFVAGISVAYAVISEKQRALRAAIDCASEEGSAMKVYGTVAMNYIQLCAIERSGEGAGSCCSNVERDNQVLTDLASTSLAEAGEKPSACRLRWSSASFSTRQR